MSLRLSSVLQATPVALRLAMTVQHCCFVWNVRGLNGRARRSVVREFLLHHRPSIVCLQETKISNFCNGHAIETLGTMFDYVVLPAVNVAGGILLGWLRDSWTATVVAVGRFSISAKMCAVGSQDNWLITAVYGPQLDEDRVAFQKCEPWAMDGLWGLQHDISSS